MIRCLTIDEVLDLHRRAIHQAGGSAGIRDLGALESAVAQPLMAFGGADLYPTIEDKACALCYSIVSNHPFVDGNKRTGHAAMETFLVLNGREIRATVDEQEQVILAVASGRLGRDGLVAWLRAHVIPFTGGSPA